MTLIGLHVNPRKKLDAGDLNRYPDYLLYGSQADSDEAFQTKDFYSATIGLLEAKRWDHNLSEDSSGKGKSPKGRSPHYQIRDYLSEAPQLNWAVLTNGSKWRLYSRVDRASAYFEFDLEAVLCIEDKDLAKNYLAIFVTLFGISAFHKTQDAPTLDEIRSEAIVSRTKLEEELREQVFQCVEILANGFLKHPDNSLQIGETSRIYEACLLLLYRILFVLNAEARGLLPTTARNEREREFYDGYSLSWVRELLNNPSTRRTYDSEQTSQLFSRLKELFRLINGSPPPPGKPDQNERLGIPRYNGGLFDPERHALIEGFVVGDRALANVIELLCYRTEDNQRSMFDYATLGERHLGSIYEGLLEHHLAIKNDRLELRNDKGERRNQGAYYTPHDFVEAIVRRTLQPLLNRINAEIQFKEDAEPNDSFGNEVLRLTVCDPAMGSGHFLVEAITFLAESVAAHPSTASRAELNADGAERKKIDGSGEPLFTQEAKLNYWRRRIAESCVYGVDLNQLAVELAKLSVWLKTVDRVPLNFLDHHLRCGNSLVGVSVARMTTYQKPTDRFDPKKHLRDKIASLYTLELQDRLRDAIGKIAEIESESTDTHAIAKHKEALWKELVEKDLAPFKSVADLWVGPWFSSTISSLPHAEAAENLDRAAQIRTKYAAVLGQVNPFHWEIEFPDVFFNEDGTMKASPGFDAVIGNPPWERIKLQENEFFSARNEAVAQATRAADRKRLIAQLKKGDPVLFKEFEQAKDYAERTLDFVQKSGFYPLMGKGDTNLYSVMTERATTIVNSLGRVGLLVPSGIATDKSSEDFFGMIVQGKRLSGLFDFENHGIFPDVDRRFKFSILLLSGQDAPCNKAECGFFFHEAEEIENPSKILQLDAADFELFNPNTRTCPIFRTVRDYELTKKLYQTAPILIRREVVNGVEQVTNPWGVRFYTMFHMTNDSELFRTAAELEKEGYWRADGNIYKKGAESYLPLYEGKMVQMYDHRAASIIVNPENIHRPAQEVPVSDQEKIDPTFQPNSHHYVPKKEIESTIGDYYRSWLLGFKSITAPTNHRSFICCSLPLAGVGNSMPVILLDNNFPSPKYACLIANLSSFALDFAARQKIGGQNLNFFIVEQFPVLPPERFASDWKGCSLEQFIKDRVLELSYTAHDMRPFAEDLGYSGEPFTWDEERRLHLRCQLDAMFFLLYGLDREEANYVLGTFPIVKHHDEERYGSFRTKDLILQYMAAYDAGDMNAWAKA